MEPQSIRAVGITRRFGPAAALRGVDITVERGERVALLGPNGAGKTTLLRVLSTALRPTSGSLTLCGIDALRDPTHARRLIGAVGHQSCLYGDLTVRENLRFYGRLYGVERLETCIDEGIERVGLGARADERVSRLSRGMQQRASLARAFLHDPDVLLLDEPETGLDDAAQRVLSEQIREWAGRGKSVILASHRLEWAQMLTDRAIVLIDGAVVREIDSKVEDSASLTQAYRATLTTLAEAKT
jgi:heme exporter protein A